MHLPFGRILPVNNVFPVSTAPLLFHLRFPDSYGKEEVPRILLFPDCQTPDTALLSTENDLAFSRYLLFPGHYFPKGSGDFQPENFRFLPVFFSGCPCFRKPGQDVFRFVLFFAVQLREVPWMELPHLSVPGRKPHFLPVKPCFLSASCSPRNSGL